MKTAIRILVGIAIAPIVAALGLAALLTLVTMTVVNLILQIGSLHGPEVPPQGDPK